VETGWKQGTEYGAHVDGFHFVAIRYDNEYTLATGWHIYVDLHLPHTHDYWFSEEEFKSVTHSSAPTSAIYFGDKLEIAEKEKVAVRKAIEQWETPATQS
jgi:hypothetical protein